MRIDFLTLFPEALAAMMDVSILGRAQKKGVIRLEYYNIRDYTINKQRQVDDYPYGGGYGMVMQADPLFRCLEAVREMDAKPARVILMSPQGAVFNEEYARRLYLYERLIFVCGHYEGVDERFIEECVDEEISIGDFVLTGGEIPAMAVADAVCRLVPGVLASETCFTEESHWSGLLEHPCYSRPEVWQNRRVPPILLSGHHKNIEAWRRRKSLERTLMRRPDMLENAELSAEDRKTLEELRAEYTQLE